MLLIVLFVIVHILEVFIAGFFNEMRSMITGWFAIRPEKPKPLSHGSPSAFLVQPPPRGESLPNSIGGRTAVARKREAVRVGGLEVYNGHIR